MKRYSKKVREEAALVLQMCQSTSWMMLQPRPHRLERGNCTESQGLAVKAFDFAYEYDSYHPYAEAEALIRTGWTP